MSTGLAPLPPVELPDGEIITETTVTALESITRAEIDIQIATARRFPRSPSKFHADVLSLVRISPEIAASCCYRKPQAGGFIEGPSVRLAEICAGAWGNLRVVPRISQETERYVVAQAVAIDLERNYAAQVEVRRGIWGKQGRYKDDMIAQTCNAAISIAYRNAVFRVVPNALVQSLYREARAFAAGKGKPIDEVREQWLEWVRASGIKTTELLATLGVASVSDLGFDHFVQLAGFQTAVETGETTLDEIFRPQKVEAIQGPAASQPSKSERLAESLNKRPNGKGTPRPEPAAADKGDGWELGGGRE